MAKEINMEKTIEKKVYGGFLFGSLEMNVRDWLYAWLELQISGFA